MSAVYELVVNQQWQVAITHIQSLTDGHAVDQIFYQNVAGWTAIMRNCYHGAPLELVQLMTTKAKLDPRKRCLLAITDVHIGRTGLHAAAWGHRHPAVVELLIREHPLALCATNNYGFTSEQCAIATHSPAAITSLLTGATNALAARDYAALATRVHGDEFALRCLVSSSYAARVRTRVSVLICIERLAADPNASYPNPRPPPSAAVSTISPRTWSGRCFLVFHREEW